MHHEISLISTITVGLVYGLIGGYVASRLRLPPLVGYLVAGVALGPFTPGFVADAKLAPQLAEIGVILLMFGVGMHFSIRDLLAVRNVAVPGALVQIASAVALTCALASLWGASLGSSLVMGLALSVASTVVLLRALEAQGILKSASGQIAIGWLIVEDLVTVIILVLLPVFAIALGGEPLGSNSAGHDHGGGELLLALGIVLAKFVGFVLFMLFVGARLLRWLLERVAATNSRELFTIAVVAAAIGIAYEAAELFGLSFALGAFFAGVVVGESDHSHRAEAELQPLQDAFTALFFVAMGMLFDPSILIRQPLQVLAVVAVIVLGKSAAAFLIIWVLRHPIGTALIIAASLAQIGEFSFILAELGIALRLLSAEGQSLIVAGALLSITLNSFLLRGATAIQSRMGEKMQKLVIDTN
ncbi:MAG: cation:proton antiporter [Verrucomicrobia bacterium]|nr:cation:proton antiporter [Verrucomicrobiota bacterium]MBV8413910.1 cation:proton antiporter [Verrucomicrobiota bacterium]